MLIKRVVR